MAFAASFVDPATNLTHSGVFEIVGGRLIPVVMKSQAVPDVIRQAHSEHQAAINDSGDIVLLRP